MAIQEPADGQHFLQGKVMVRDSAATVSNWYMHDLQGWAKHNGGSRGFRSECIFQDGPFSSFALAVRLWRSRSSQVLCSDYRHNQHTSLTANPASLR